MYIASEKPQAVRVIFRGGTYIITFSEKYVKDNIRNIFTTQDCLTLYPFQKCSLHVRSIYTYI